MGSAVSSSSFSDYVDDINKRRIEEHYQKLNKSHKTLVLSPKSLNYVYKNQSAQSSPNISMLIPDKSKMFRSRSMATAGRQIAYLQKREHSILSNRKQLNDAESSLCSSSFSSQQSSELFSKVKMVNNNVTSSSQHALTPLIETDLT